MATIILTSTTLTTDNIRDFPLPRDMQDEVTHALESGEETHAEYRVEGDSLGNVIQYIYLPNCGRGGVCTNADTDWTDCNSVEDLIDRWLDYADRWSN